MNAGHVASQLRTESPPMDDVWNVVEAVWESLLGCWPTPAEPVDVRDDWVTAVITVDGDLVGEVHVGWPGHVAHLGIWHTGSGLLHPSTTPPSN